MLHLSEIKCSNRLQDFILFNIRWAVFRRYQNVLLYGQMNLFMLYSILYDTGFNITCLRCWPECNQIINENTGQNRCVYICITVIFISKCASDLCCCGING